MKTRCSACALLVLAGWLAGAEPGVTDGNLAAVVDDRLARWWLTPDERRFDQIAWARDIREALKLSAQSQRPVFLFTMDGRVNTGRC